mmetsp:Transcript_55684/g.161350  ORF Transcript_55684/g.161350 Transcript_55684/m.161350 type:complete len:256 (+) Transcript_55684:151-918(+)
MKDELVLPHLAVALRAEVVPEQHRPVEQVILGKAKRRRGHSQGSVGMLGMTVQAHRRSKKLLDEQHELADTQGAIEVDVVSVEEDGHRPLANRRVPHAYRLGDAASCGPTPRGPQRGVPGEDLLPTVILDDAPDRLTPHRHILGHLQAEVVVACLHPYRDPVWCHVAAWVPRLDNYIERAPQVEPGHRSRRTAVAMNAGLKVFLAAPEHQRPTRDALERRLDIATEGILQEAAREGQVIQLIGVRGRQNPATNVT